MYTYTYMYIPYMVYVKPHNSSTGKTSYNVGRVNCRSFLADTKNDFQGKNALWHFHLTMVLLL